MLTLTDSENTMDFQTQRDSKRQKKIERSDIRAAKISRVVIEKMQEKTRREVEKKNRQLGIHDAVKSKLNEVTIDNYDDRYYRMYDRHDSGVYQYDFGNTVEEEEDECADDLYRLQVQYVRELKKIIALQDSEDEDQRSPNLLRIQIQDTEEERLRIRRLLRQELRDFEYNISQSRHTYYFW